MDAVNLTDTVYTSLYMAVNMTGFYIGLDGQEPFIYVEVRAVLTRRVTSHKVVLVSKLQSHLCPLEVKWTNPQVGQN